MKLPGYVPYRERAIMSRDFADKLRIAAMVDTAVPSQRMDARMAAAWLINERHPGTMLEEIASYFDVTNPYTIRRDIRDAPSNPLAMRLAEKWRADLPEEWKVRRLKVRHVANDLDRYMVPKVQWIDDNHALACLRNKRREK